MHDSKKRAEVELAALLSGLRYRGLAVGTDDAARVARVFRHASGWTRQRCVRVLKCLLARTDEERRVIEQLAPFLFVNVERRAEARASGPRLGAAATEEAPPVGAAGDLPRDSGVRETTPLGGPLRQRRIEHGRVIKIAALGSGLVLAAMVGLKLLLPTRPAFTGLDTGTRPQQSEEFDVAPPPERARWPFAVLTALSVLPIVDYTRRRLRAVRQDDNLSALLTSRGPRTYRLDLPADRASTPQNPRVVREAAFRLSAPSANVPAPWLDVYRTVESTARNAGRLTLRYDTWLEHRPILFVEDVSPSMARWPLFGFQMHEAINRQGGDVHRYYMDGTPDVLSTDPELRHTVPLEQVLAGLSDPAVVVISDARALNSQSKRHASHWIGALSHATWLHPREVEVWGRGARWLAELIRVVPLSDQGMPRLGMPQFGGDVGLGRRWRPARVIGNRMAARLAMLRVSLGQEVFWWMAAGAVLDRVGALNRRLWWALRSEGIIEAPRGRVERVWELEGVDVRADGTVRLAVDLREALIDALAAERPKLLSDVVGWAEGLVAADVEELDENSIASITARAMRARLQLIDPRRRREGRRNLQALAKGGFGKWADTGVSDGEREDRGRVRLARTERPGRGAKAGVAAGAMVFMASGTFVAIPDILAPSQDTTLHFGLVSLLPAVIALTLAIKSKRVIAPLLFGILSGVLVLDASANGWGHSLLYSIVNLFNAIAGHPENSGQGIEGVGMLKNAARPEVIFIVMLLGAFMMVLHRSGGSLAFGEWVSKRVETERSAQNAAAIMGCLMFTSAYFSSLATGAVFRPVFDKLKVSRAKLAFIIDATAAPVMAIVPISGWVAYMATLLGDHVPNLDDGFRGLLLTVPLNFYCLTVLVFVFLLTSGVIKDFGPMKSEEEKVLRGESGSYERPREEESADKIKKGKPGDMAIPLGMSIVLLLTLGLWNYAFAYFFESVERLPLSGYEILIISFSLGIATGFIRYTLTGLMTAAEFLDDALDGTKSAIIGAIIIILALTLGDLLGARAPEGLGTAQYLESIVGGMILPPAIVPFAAFLISSFMAFAMGNSWGVWAIMMPIAMPLTLGGNPFLVAAAVLSGGVFGDHSSPISDTTIMSSIGAECDHMTHVNTQLPYALTAAGIAAALFLIGGFVL